MIEPQINYPLFFNAGSLVSWQALNAQADSLLGYSNEGAETYSAPIVDKNGNHYFVVNPEVSSLVDLDACVSYESIEFESLN